jgi:hypothetical protein
MPRVNLEGSSSIVTGGASELERLARDNWQSSAQKLSLPT